VPPTTAPGRVRSGGNQASLPSTTLPQGLRLRLPYSAVSSPPTIVASTLPYSGVSVYGESLCVCKLSVTDVLARVSGSQIWPIRREAGGGVTIVQGGDEPNGDQALAGGGARSCITFVGPI
jgi:hypothetical protein